MILPMVPSELNVAKIIQEQKSMSDESQYNHSQANADRGAKPEKASPCWQDELAERNWSAHIYRASPIGLCCFDTQLRYIDVNDWLAALNGIPVEEHLGRTIHEVVPDVAAGVELQLRHVIETGLRNQQSELTHAARLNTLGEMAASMAHELNQPLTAMSAFAEGELVRLERGTLRETVVPLVFSRIAEDAQRAGNIIRRLRNFLQKRETQRQRIDVNDLVMDIHKFVESDVKHAGITIQFKLADGLPAVEADLIEIQQVLLNLIRNASDAVSRSDCDERRIVISSHEQKPDGVEDVVEDSGPGISDSMAEQVFEPFFSSKADGLGIGLGICQNIIEAHRGKMWLGHSLMGGASIHFNLPLHQREDEINAS
jgi:C4-dicarboxylate-specific signal transduction histidine kinase